MFNIEPTIKRKFLLYNIGPKKKIRCQKNNLKKVMCTD